jgi:hypothetical protein
MCSRKLVIFRFSRHAVSLKQTDVSEVRTASDIALMIEAARTSETSVYFNEITWRFFPEGSDLGASAAPTCVRQRPYSRTKSAAAVNADSD